MPETLCGVDVLARERFATLHGKRVGLVTNHTGLSREGRSTADLLHEAPGVELLALFGPEHGIRGEQDERIEDGIDIGTGLPVYSLYGANEKPTGEQLRPLDTLVFDIQDIGCRFYTYISTLVKIMEAASEEGKSVVVLDRPNPINGVAVEGPLPDTDKLSFVASHRIPVRHGMTIGELALLIHAERVFSCPLEIVACEGWRRTEWFDQTGLLWTDPSPNMRSLEAALLYPGVGLPEMTNVSVGRGTDTPFQVIGAPYIDPRVFAAAMNDIGLSGLRFYPVYFMPQASKFVGKVCGGVRILVVDRAVVQPVQLGLTLALALRRLYHDVWSPDKLLTLLVAQSVFDDVLIGIGNETPLGHNRRDADMFLARRAPFLLYGA